MPRLPPSADHPVCPARFFYETKAGNNVITLQNVSKRYKGITITKDSGVYLWIKNLANLTGNKASSLLAVNNISFTVNAGEVFGIYGANGAGKTTIIKLLSGLLEPDNGTVEIDKARQTRHIKNKVSYISTNGWMGLEWQLTARENLVLYGSMFGLSGKKLAEKCDEVLHAVGMFEAKDKYISELSAGMRQKITIARGLVLDRPVIFYDEPSVSLDVQSAGNLRDLIKADAEKNNRTAIIASHNAEDLAVCGRIMMLANGEIIAIGTLDELKQPLSGFEMIEINCLNQGRDINLESVSGVASVTYGSIEGKRDILNIKINARKPDFSYDRLIDRLIECNAAVYSINPIEISLQEIYEHYLSQRGGDGVAV